MGKTVEAFDYLQVLDGILHAARIVLQGLEQLDAAALMIDVLGMHEGHVNKAPARLRPSLIEATLEGRLGDVDR